MNVKLSLPLSSFVVIARDRQFSAQDQMGRRHPFPLYFPNYQSRIIVSIAPATQVTLPLTVIADRPSHGVNNTASYQDHFTHLFPMSSVAHPGIHRIAVPLRKVTLPFAHSCECVVRVICGTGCHNAGSSKLTMDTGMLRMARQSCRRVISSITSRLWKKLDSV